LSLLLIWVVYTAIATGFVSVVFIWAVRSGQFGDSERARRLPLVEEGDASNAAVEGERARW